LAFHSRRPITFRLLDRNTNIPWIPFKGKQKIFPFVKNAKDGGIEKFMLKLSKEEEEETRKSASAAATTDLKQAHLVCLME
jgi:hypothetical protein